VGFCGAEFLYTLGGLPSGTTLLALVPSHHNHALKEPIGIRLEPAHLVLFERERENDEKMESDKASDLTYLWILKQQRSSSRAALPV
jgi:hypothetical protein